MDQELKQRLIGAAVITALAAIFVPMLFDDPIDETGKSINELKIPELPAKVQDVEIMPLPEKVEDVATTPPIEKPLKTAPAFVEEGAEEADLEAPRPQIKLGAKDTVVAPAQARVVTPDPEAIHGDAEDAAEAEDVRPVTKPVKQTPQAAAKAPVVSAPAPVAIVKPVVKTEPAAVESVVKPAAVAEGVATRWYLNAGSFSQKANAVTVQDSLKQQGFAASIKEVAGEKGTVFKVRVGPMLDKAKAQAVKSKLAQININTFVTGDE